MVDFREGPSNGDEEARGGPEKWAWEALEGSREPKQAAHTKAQQSKSKAAQLQMAISRHHEVERPRKTPFLNRLVQENRLAANDHGVEGLQEPLEAAAEDGRAN